MKELNAILTIAYRDLLKFLRDRTRIVSTFILPLLLVGILGGSLESNLGQSAQYSCSRSRSSACSHRRSSSRPQAA